MTFPATNKNSFSSDSPTSEQILASPRIIIVDDSVAEREFILSVLTRAGYVNISQAGSFLDAMKVVRRYARIDLILLDVVMPQIDGLTGCKLLKQHFRTADVPVIIITARSDVDTLARAFRCGAMDYIAKPFNEIELIARVRSALNLKSEMDRRRDRERDLLALTEKLIEVNEALLNMSFIDGLTTAASRSYFDENLSSEIRRLRRINGSVSLILADLDYFRLYNESLGHVAGDNCLKAVAGAIKQTLWRPGDFVARFDGEEFAVVLPETDQPGGLEAARRIQESIARLALPHPSSPCSDIVTLSLGLVTASPGPRFSATELVEQTNDALYQAKSLGRNRLVFDFMKERPAGVGEWT